MARVLKDAERAERDGRLVRARQRRLATPKGAKAPR
jgi:hypothetical protein